MAIFIRKELKVGAWGYAALATPGDTAPATVPAQRVLTLGKSDLTKGTGLWSTTYSQVFVVGHGSRRSQATKLSQDRPVVLTFTSGDSTGLEARQIKRFFTYDSPIQYYDNERKVPPTDLFVTAIDVTAYDGSVTVEISATTTFSDEIVEDKKIAVASETISAEKTYTLTDFVNDLHSEATLRVTLSSPNTNSPVDYKGAEVEVTTTSDLAQAAGSIIFLPATRGNSAIGFRGYEWTVDSLDETISGSGIVQPTTTTKFFSVPAGGSINGTIRVKPPTDGSVKVTASLVSTFARGTWAQVNEEDA